MVEQSGHLPMPKPNSRPKPKPEGPILSLTASLDPEIPGLAKQISHFSCSNLKRKKRQRLRYSLLWDSEAKDLQADRWGFKGPIVAYLVLVYILRLIFFKNLLGLF